MTTEKLRAILDKCPVPDPKIKKGSIPIALEGFIPSSEQGFAAHAFIDWAKSKRRHKMALAKKDQVRAWVAGIVIASAIKAKRFSDQPIGADNTLEAASTPQK